MTKHRKHALHHANAQFIAQAMSQPFRSYATMADSFTVHGQFLANNGRYRQYLKDYAANGDARAFARGLQKAGYATDPHYAELLIGIIDKYKLYQHDVAKTPAAAAPADSAPARRLP